MTTTGSPTLREIAEAAGVSVGTVSATLNNRSSVAASTKAKVLDVAVSLGYEPKRRNRLADDVDLGVIGLLIKHNIGSYWETNPFYSRVQLGVTNTCHQHEIGLMVANVEVDESNHPISWPTMINEQRINGLIMAGAFIDDTVHMFKRKSDIPIVLVDGYAPYMNCDTVVTDNRGGAHKAVRHLVEQGHTHIGLLGWNPHSPPSIQQRQQGYLDILGENGLEPFIAHTELSRHGGEAGARMLLSNGQKVTALLCCNDETAFGAMSAARDLGLAIPQDLSLIGFDNLDMARETVPALTTIHVHKSWMGALGVQTLIERVRNPERPHITIVLSTDLVERDTVSRPR